MYTAVLSLTGIRQLKTMIQATRLLRSRIQDNLENRTIQVFVLGQQLLLDETLIHQIKFKVRIVTKAARYGIKYMPLQMLLQHLSFGC
jgi:hypothetical protein